MIQRSIIAPNIRNIGLSQPLIIAVFLLPLHETALQNIYFLLLALFLAERTLSLASVTQSRGWTPLLAEGAVEDNLLHVLEGAEKLWQANV